MSSSLPQMKLCYWSGS